MMDGSGSGRARIALVVAVAENGVIGSAGGLPWRLSSDLKYFKEITMGKPIIMGRKTFQSIGRPLPGRRNIVVSRQRGFAHDGVTVTTDVEAALEVARSDAQANGVCEICIIGGGEIYRQTLDLADRIYLTQVHMNVEGDTHFPDLDGKRWMEVNRERRAAGESDSSDFSLIVLDRLAVTQANEARQP